MYSCGPLDNPKITGESRRRGEERKAAVLVTLWQERGTKGIRYIFGGLVCRAHPTFSPGEGDLLMVYLRSPRNPWPL